MRRIGAALGVATILGATIVAVAVLGSAAASGRVPYPLDPAHNIAPPATVWSSACATRPMARPCEDTMIAALDRARRAMGQPAYDLPGRFRSLAARDQLLVLSNLDRRLYGRAPIRGLNRRLNASASAGVRADDDPQFIYNLNGNRLTGGGSNWFASYGVSRTSPLLAYYEWMYDDGYGSDNITCRTPESSGCWLHREDTLFAAPAGSQVEMGVGSGYDRQGAPGWSELYESFDGSALIPCMPSVVGMSSHTAPTGGTVVVLHGYGFVSVTKVSVLGRLVRVLDKHPTSLTIRVPAHRPATGYIAVYTTAGRSVLNAAASFTYLR